MIRPYIKRLLAEFLLDDKKTDIELVALAIGNLKTSDQPVMKMIGDRLDQFVIAAMEESKKILVEIEQKKVKPKLRLIK